MAAWDNPIAEIRRLESALSRARELAGEWAEEGPSLVRNAYSGSDVHEGQTLERCARALTAALDGEGYRAKGEA